MTEEVKLLKHGNPMAYRICDCCNHYARGLSARNWCPACEFELTAIGKRVREKLARLTPAPPTSVPAGSTEPAFHQTPPGAEGSW